MPAPDEPKLEEPLALPLPDAPALPGLAEPGVSSVWVPEDIPAAVQPGFAGFSFRPVVELPLVDVTLADEPLLLLLPVPLLPDVPVPEFGDELVVPALFEPLLLPALPGAAAGPAAPAAPEAPPAAPPAGPAASTGSKCNGRSSGQRRCGKYGNQSARRALGNQHCGIRVLRVTDSNVTITAPFHHGAAAQEPLKFYVI